MPYIGLAISLIIVLGITNAARIRHWWRKGCDRCRLEDIGGAEWSHTAHTCFPWRNPYRDSRGDVWEFGKRIRMRKTK